MNAHDEIGILVTGSIGLGGQLRRRGGRAWQTAQKGMQRNDGSKERLKEQKWAYKKTGDVKSKFS